MTTKQLLDIYNYSSDPVQSKIIEPNKNMNEVTVEEEIMYSILKVKISAWVY